MRWYLYLHGLSVPISHLQYQNWSAYRLWMSHINHAWDMKYKQKHMHKHTRTQNTHKILQKNKHIQKKAYEHTQTITMKTEKT